jgi:two-component system LytT family response regulator
VNRLLKTREATTGERLNVLRQTLSENKNQEASIAIPTSDGLEFLVIKNIVHIESSANYSRIYLSNGKTILVTRLLKDFEEMLVPYRFFRVHHSHLINLNYIQKYIRGDGGQVVMQTGETIDVARRKKDDFLALIS